MNYQSVREFRDQMVLNACRPVLRGIQIYFVLVTFIIAAMVPPDLRVELVTQKALFVVFFSYLRARVGSVPRRYAHVLVSVMLGACLVSVMISEWCGVHIAHNHVMVIGVGLLDLHFGWAILHWAACWAFWLSHQNGLENILAMFGAQLLAIIILAVHRENLDNEFKLLQQSKVQETRLSQALEESETNRRQLDLRVEERTCELRRAYEELLKSTEQRQKLEQTILQAQKMESLGLLAGGVAHDFNNLLTVILGNLDICRSLVQDGTEEDDLIREAETAAKRAAEVTSQLLAFSRKQVMQVKQIELNAVVEDSSKLVRRLVGEDVAVTVRLSPEPCPLLADPVQLRQVLLNLVGNARDAMPNGGSLEIAVGRNPESPANWATLTVADSGAGLDPLVMSRIFEPFFTTKDFGKGTGLGLSIVHGIVTQHGGRVEVKGRASGQGTVFEIHLPLVDAQSPESSGRLRVRTGPPGTGTILLVEDDGQLRSLTARILERSGYRVIQAKNGEEALSLFRGANLDLLLTDVVMPGMDGACLAANIREVRPDLPVLFMSGYTDDRLSHLGIDSGSNDIITKPFVPATLCQSVRLAMAGRG